MYILGIAGNLGSGKDSVAKVLEEQHGFITIAFADALKRLVGKIFLYPNEVMFGPSDLRNKPDERVKSGEHYWNRVHRNYLYHQKDVLGLFEGGPPIEDMSILERFSEQIQVCFDQKEALTPRFVLQRIGTEWARAIWQDVWLNQVSVVIQAIRNGHHYNREKGIIPFEPLATMALKPLPITEIKGIAIPDTRFVNEAKEVHKWMGKLIWIEASKRNPQNPAHAHSSEPKREDFKVDGKDLIDYDLDNNGEKEGLPDRVKLAVKKLFEPASIPAPPNPVATAPTIPAPAPPPASASSSKPTIPAPPPTQASKTTIPAPPPAPKTEKA